MAKSPVFDFTDQMQRLVISFDLVDISRQILRSKRIQLAHASTPDKPWNKCYIVNMPRNCSAPEII